MAKPRWMLMLMSALAVGVLGLGGLEAPVLAGGSWLSPVLDRYEPGDTVTMVGYTQGSHSDAANPLEVHIALGDEDFGQLPSSEQIAVGSLEVEQTGEGGWLQLRVSISFDLPPDLVPGPYVVGYCNADCTYQLGDLIGGNLWVGVDPASPLSREWPLSEPEIANLDPESLVAGPGYSLTAREIIEAAPASVPTTVLAADVEGSRPTLVFEPPEETVPGGGTTNDVIIPPSVAVVEPPGSSTPAPDGSTDAATALIEAGQVEQDGVAGWILALSIAIVMVGLVVAVLLAVALVRRLRRS